MSKMRSKWMLAGVFSACAFGAITVGIVWATPPQGVTPELIAGPVSMDEANVESQGVKIKIKGLWESYALRFHVEPGGDFGWHTHPGPVFVMVTAGELSVYGPDDPTPTVYPAGTGFVEEPSHVHIGGNAGDTALELVAFFLTPPGEDLLIDEDEPQP